MGILYDVVLKVVEKDVLAQGGAYTYLKLTYYQLIYSLNTLATPIPIEAKSISRSMLLISRT